MCPSSSLFQPTLPLRGATSRRCRPSREASCFNPRSPCGERRASGAWRLTKPPVFQPTLPLRGATRLAQLLQRALPFQPTLPLRGATMTLYYGQHFFGFQPTLPLRGATRPILSALSYRDTFQPTLPLRGATQGRSLRDLAAGFQPTLPLRGATALRASLLRLCGVSTHAPLAGSDPTQRRLPRCLPSFNPRSPCGERLPFQISLAPLPCFNPRSPCGERRGLRA